MASHADMQVTLVGDHSLPMREGCDVWGRPPEVPLHMHLKIPQC